MYLLFLGSDDERPRHTTLRYRRKKGGQWRQVEMDVSDMKKGEEDELLVMIHVAKIKYLHISG